MKVSLNFLKDYNQHKYATTGDITGIGTDKLIEKIGAQLGGIDEAINFGKRYENIVVVKVVSCEKHPNADKLSLCRVDDNQFIAGVERGDDDLVQVVCGAPNVRAGMLAAWIPPGNPVPETAGENPLILEKRDIRGKVSNGMLASPKELGISDSHTGILEIDEDVKPGVPFDEVYNLGNDVVLDVENKMFTHRPDCFGWLGIDRELAGIQQMAFKSPNWYQVEPEAPQPEADVLPITINNELPELVPRFTMLPMSGIKVGSSPVWLQIELAKVGQKPINNVVDVTNYLMLLTGQPLHAYDYDKVMAFSPAEPTIVIRNPKPGEKLALLNGKAIEPRPGAIMIATDKQSIGLGGVMGGADTEVDENTKKIILECANFDMYSIRRTVMEHGIFTEAGTRFTKGQSPLQNLAVLAKAAELLTKEAGGKVAGPVLDDNHLDDVVMKRGSIYPSVRLTKEFVNERLGLNLSAEEMKQLLTNVEFKVEVKGDELTVTAPFWRTDIELREDVVEEVGRLYGYDHVPLKLPQRDLTPASKDPLLEVKAKIRGQLAEAGANEVLTYSFVHSDLLQKAGQDTGHAFQISNAISPDLQYYRLSLIPSLLEKVHPNIKAGYDEFALFEIGKAHLVEFKDDEGLPREDELTALVIAAADKLKQPGEAYYQAKKYLEDLVRQKLTYKPVPDNMQAFDITKPYNMNRAGFIYAGDVFLGIIGEFRPSVSRSLKLPRYCAGFEIDTSALMKILSQTKYIPLPRFPEVIQDITLQVPANLAYQELFDFTESELEKHKPENSLVQLGPINIYQKEDSHKNVTLRLTIASYDRTLTDAEVNKLLDQVAVASKGSLGAQRI